MSKVTWLSKGIVAPLFCSHFNLFSAPDKVSNLFIESRSHDSVNVHWTSPFYWCGVLFYEVCITLINLDQCNQNVNFPMQCSFTDDTLAILNSLKSHSSYNISVSAMFGSFEGEPMYGVETTLETG